MKRQRILTFFAILLTTSSFGCAHYGYYGGCQTGECHTQVCTTGGCDTGGCDSGCNTCETGCYVPWYRRPLGSGLRCRTCNWGSGHCAGKLAARFRSNAIPDTLPLGSTVRAHYQVMQTNGEAADFILYNHDFVGETAELTSDGKDKIMEISARMRSDPFPVLVERSENNSNPELDAMRRNLIAQILSDHGNPDADQRTIVSQSYGLGFNSIQAESNYYRYLFSNGGNNNFGNGNAGGGFGGGFGGGNGGGGFGN